MTVRKVSIRALDGEGITGTLFENEDGENRFVAVVCPGGGLPAALYRRWASWTASNGIPVLTFDYRGIGCSRNGSLRKMSACFEDWAEHDIGGAIQWLGARFPNASIVGIAHSIGALLLAGAPNSDRLHKAVLVGPHTGYWRDYGQPWRMPMASFWHGLMPLIVRVVGYFPGRMFGLPEDIPPNVALQWAARTTPEFRPEESPSPERSRSLLRHLRDFRARALVLSFSDDAFSTPRAVRRVLDLLPGMPVELRHWTPESAAVASIGHFGFFRRGADRTFWINVLEWINRRD